MTTSQSKPSPVLHPLLPTKAKNESGKRGKAEEGTETKEGEARNVKKRKEWKVKKEKRGMRRRGGNGK